MRLRGLDGATAMDEAERTLLIVDDDKGFGTTLAAEFTDRGYKVDWLDGLQAVEQMTDLDHHCAVVDLRLGQDSGLDVIKLLKTRSPATIVVVLTGYGSVETARVAIELGASAYLTKPVDIDQLERTLMGDPATEPTPSASSD
jgi:two-component system response regulator RegA